MDLMGAAFVAFVVALLLAAALGFGADSRDGADGSGILGRRHHRQWTWW